MNQCRVIECRVWKSHQRCPVSAPSLLDGWTECEPTLIIIIINNCDSFHSLAIHEDIRTRKAMSGRAWSAAQASLYAVVCALPEWDTSAARRNLCCCVHLAYVIVWVLRRWSDNDIGFNVASVNQNQIKSAKMSFTRLRENKVCEEIQLLILCMRGRCFLNEAEAVVWF